MNGSDFLAAVQADLEPFIEADKGSVFMAADPFHALEILAASPAAYFVVILDKGEETETNGPIQWLVPKVGLYVAQQKGFQANPGAHIIPLSQRCENARDRVLSKVHDPEESDKHPEYLGKSLVTLPDGMPLAAYELNFSLRVSGPSLTYRS